MGDHSKLPYLKEVIRVISEENLLERARDSGKFLLDGLRELEVYAFMCVLFFVFVFFLLVRVCVCVFFTRVIQYAINMLTLNPSQFYCLHEEKLEFMSPPCSCYCDVQNKYPGLFSRPRGLGTVCAVDFPDVETRTEFIAKVRNNGKSLPLGAGTFRKFTEFVTLLWQEKGRLSSQLTPGRLF